MNVQEANIDDPSVDRPASLSRISRETTSARRGPQELVKAIGNRIQPWDMFLLGMLVLLAFKVDWGVHLMRDVSTPDEMFYMHCGLSYDYPTAQMSPLYCAWYSLLSLVVPDPIVLFFTSWFLLPLMLAFAVYLLARSLGGAPLFAFLAAAIILLSRIPDVGPRPVHFAMTLVLIGLAIAFTFRSAAARLTVATLAVGLAAYVRPEITVAFLGLAAMLLAVLGWEAWQRPRSIARPVGLCILGLLPFCLLAASFEFPLGGNRSGVAFSQHYSLSKFNAGLIDVETRPNWLGPYRSYQAIVEEDFGKPIVSPREAWRIAPAKVLAHFRRNAAAMLPQSRGVMTSVSDAVSWGIWGFLALLALVGLSRAVARLRQRPLPDLASRAGLPLVIGLVVIAPTVAACLVIYPREHYLVGLLAVLLAYVASQTGSVSLPGGAAPRRSAVAAIAAVIILLAPNNFVQWDFQKLFASNPSPPTRRAMLEDIRFMRQIPFQGPLRALDGGLFYFTTFDYEIHDYTVVKSEGFAEALRNRELNVLVVPAKMNKYDPLRHDPDYFDFRMDPPPNWVILGEPKLIWWIAVRKDALKPVPADRLVIAPPYEVRFKRHAALLKDKGVIE